MRTKFSAAIRLIIGLGFIFSLIGGSIGRVQADSPTELFFSEYIEGSSNNKALEIYNGTGAAIDLALSGYNIQMFFNGSVTAGLTINLTGIVANGEVFVIAQSSAVAAILDQADQTNGAGWFNGDDAIVLRKGTDFIDSIGQIGYDPGAQWGVDLVSTADNTLRRKTCAGDTNASDIFDPSQEWDGYASDTFDGLGAHTANCTVADNAPSVVSAYPADGANPVNLDVNLTVTFSEAVDAALDWFTLTCSLSGSVTAAVSGGPTEFSIDPDADLLNSESCTLTVFAASITDQDTDDPPDNMVADYSTSFTTAALVDPAPGVVSTSPADGAVDVPLASNLSITFSEAVDVTDGWYDITCADSGAHTALVTGGPDTFTLDPDVDFALSETCTVNLYAANITDQDTSDPENAMLADYSFTYTTIAAVAPLIMINELDSDTDGTDVLEFVELYDGGVGNTSLNGVTIVFFNGSNDLSYFATSLDGFATDSSGYFVIGNAGLTPAPSITFANNFLQNGPDAVALYFTAAANFPNNTAVTTTNLIDAVAYDTSDPDDTGLLALLNTGQPQVDEAGWSNSPGHSIQRCPNGSGDLRNTNTYAQWTPTPGTANVCTEICGDVFTPAYTIQGALLASPLAGKYVTVEGVVVGDFQSNASEDDGDLNGFHIQDPVGDGNTATSDGVFIYRGNLDVATGDAVRVRGRVSEYNGLTEITASQVLVCSSGGAITPTPVTLPMANAESFESYEGMLVSFPQDLIISEYFEFDRYGSIVLTSERHMTPTALYEPGADAIAAAAAFLLDKITLDDGRSVQNPDPAIHPNGAEFSMDNLFRGGDTLTNVTGVMDYSFNLYRVHPTQGADYSPVNPRPAAPVDVGGDMKVVSMNTLNYFSTIDYGSAFWFCGPNEDQECRGADTEEEFIRQRAKLIEAMYIMDADIFGLLEIENNVDDEAVQDLVNGLNDKFGAGTYDYVHTGVIGTDAIKVALLYKPSSVSLVGNYAILDSTVDSRFNDDKNRPVLAQTFEVNNTGARFTVAVNHLKSKGSDCLDVGDPDLGDGAGNCNLTRKLAAQAEVDWLAEDPTASGDPDFLIIGDLNSYDKEDPIDAFRAGPDDVLGTADDYVDMVFDFEGENAYSYVFDGQIGYLDYVLSSALAEQITGVTTWHVNADEPDLIDYNMDFKLDAQDALYAPDQYRYSDHDPVIVGLTPNAAPTVDAGGPYNVIEGKSVTVSAIGTDPNGDILSYMWDLDNDGIFETPGQSVELTVPMNIAPATLTINVQVTDPLGLTATDSATVYVVYDFLGFFQPVDNLPTYNIVKAGSIIPVKFSLGGNQGLNIFAEGYPVFESGTCPLTLKTDAIEKTTRGRESKLVYDPIKRQYVYTWVTSKSWAGTCGTLTIKLVDGTVHQANFLFK